MANPACPGNTTGISNVFLLGFQDLPDLQSFLFVNFLIIYVLTILGNALIVVTVCVDARLHSPMYFFLGNLSFLEVWYTTTTVPTMLGGLIMEVQGVPLATCITQLYFFGSLVTTECFLLTLMAYDRYVAICFPLRYSSLMDQRLCRQLAACAWTAGFVIASFTSLLLCRIEFSDRSVIDHFFCDLAPLLKVACSDTTWLEMEVFAMSFIVLSVPFLLIILSYVYIILAIVRIPSATGRNKAFSTCSSHLTVVITYFSLLIIMYVVPTSGHTFNLNKALSLLYCVATPMVNPVIYTLRNKEIRGTWRKILNKLLPPPRLGK
ncbi:olfactory receptor 11L1-like [Ambystoma mexicanum]|uniref:olfactory receptor 11L1-like n=1 Tax=Ambystoma mexicanum TaxID=8296 RepID=UPI0037E9BE5E